MPYTHAMIIGGTGMLSAASRHLANHSAAISLFARTPASLNRLHESFSSTTARAHLAPVDYYQTSTFHKAVHDAIDALGPPDLVLAWFHDDPPAHALAALLVTTHTPLHFFHVLGTGSANPAASFPESRQFFDRLPFITYHQIVLGFSRTDHHSRWLTHDEIAAGVIHAMNYPTPLHIVGTVSPWTDRPVG